MKVSFLKMTDDYALRGKKRHSQRRKLLLTLLQFPNFNLLIVSLLGKLFYVMFSCHVVTMYHVKRRNLIDSDFLREVKSLRVNIPQMERPKLTVIWVTRCCYCFLLMLCFSNFQIIQSKSWESFKKLVNTLKTRYKYCDTDACDCFE